MMANLKELIEQLQSKDWKMRQAAAQGLAKVAPEEREQALRALQDRLTVEDDNDVIEAIVEALLQLGTPEPEVFRLLEPRVSHEDTKAKVRLGVVRGLAKLQDPKIQEKAVKILKPRLAVEVAHGWRDYFLWQLIKEISEVLVQWGVPEEEVYQELLRSWESDERRDAARRLAEKAPEVLRQRLAEDNKADVIEAIVEALHEVGVEVEELSRILVRNPHLSEWIHDLWWHRGGVVGQVLDHTLHRRWWRLPPDVRRHFVLPSPAHGPWHHCPRCFEMWHELVHLFRRRSPGEPEAERLIYALQRVWGPRWHFASHDFEALMSLRVAQNVVYEEQDVLRFRFLDVYATDPQGRPLRDWIRQFQDDWDRLLETEDAFDRLRDEIADLLRQLDEILAEAERRQEGRPLEPGERLPQDLQGRWDEIMGRFRNLEGALHERRRPLEEATRRLLPDLRDRGVRFRVVEIEGVLGDYNFYERKVTLYPPMIELAAQDLASDLGRPPEEVYDDLYTITEMHETAHATAHLGMDSNGMVWERPEDGVSALHELLAQFYTIQLIRRLKDYRLEQVFLKLNEKQPERYRYWRILEGVSLEKARMFLTAQRTGKFRVDWFGGTKDEPPLMSLLISATWIVNKAMPLIRSIYSEAEFQVFSKQLRSVSEEIEKASNRWELAQALENLLTVLESHPYILELLQRTLPFGWPTAEDRKLLLADLLVEGEPLRAPSLRLTMDQIRAAQTAVLMQNDLIRRNTIVHQLRTAVEIEKLLSSSQESQSRKKRKASG